MYQALPANSWQHRKRGGGKIKGKHHGDKRAQQAQRADAILVGGLGATQGKRSCHISDGLS